MAAIPDAPNVWTGDQAGATSQASDVSWRATDRRLQVRLGDDVQLGFDLDGGMLLALTEARIGGVPLVAPASGRAPHVETRDGWTIHGYRLAHVRAEGESVVIEATALAVRSPLGRRTDCFHVPYVATPVRVPQEVGTLRWRFTARRATIGHAAVRQHQYRGFSYSYEFELRHSFHWVLDAGTWELGGDPVGVTLFSQHMAAVGGPMEQLVASDGPPYTSAETFEKDASNSADVFDDTSNDPNERYVVPVQAQLRGAGGALVDVQWKQDSVLLCFYDRPDYYRTLVEFRPGEKGIGHLDHHFFPRTRRHATPEKHVLAAIVPGLTRAGALNCWTDAWDHVAGLWRDEAGLSAVEPVPSVGIDCCGRAGVHLGYGPADLLDKWEARFPWMRDNGFAAFFLGGIGSHRGHELPGRANMCQPYDYRIHARYGGPERFSRFCRRAHEHGIRIAQWIGVPSSFAPVLEEHPDWIVRYDCGAHWDGNYRVLSSPSLRRGFARWLLEELRYLKDLGLDMVFFDSYHNLWAMPVDYGRPDLVPQFKDLVALQAECEKIGLRSWVESFSPFGLTSPGFWKQYAAVPELSYRTHYRALADDHVAGRPNEFRNGTVTPALYFRMLANKSPIGFTVMDLDNDPFLGTPDVPEEIGRMNRMYNELRPDMVIRTVHENGDVEWTNPATGGRILFSVGQHTLTVPDGWVAEPVHGTERVLPAGTHDAPGPAAFRMRKA